MVRTKQVYREVDVIKKVEDTLGIRMSHEKYSG